MYYLYGQVISDGKIHKNQFVEITDGVISYVGDRKRNAWHIHQVESGYICPGLVDIHIHAVDGFDFTDEDGEVFNEIAKRLPKYGVTSFLATSRTLSKGGLTRFLHSAESYLGRETPHVCKVHILRAHGSAINTKEPSPRNTSVDLLGEM